MPVLVGYLLLFAYSTMIFTEFPRLKTFKMFNGLLGVALVAVAVAGGLGLSALMGVKFNATSSKVLPFLLMGLGVDDMFVLACNINLEYDDLPDLHAVMGRHLGQIGPSILLTSLTNFICFLCGMMSTLPLAVANLGDRGGSYRRDSSVYELDAAADKPLRLVQSLPTLGATDFKAFTISGTTFLAVSNEQDDRLGGDVDSTIWALSGGRAAPKEEL